MESTEQKITYCTNCEYRSEHEINGHYECYKGGFVTLEDCCSRGKDRDEAD